MLDSSSSARLARLHCAGWGPPGRSLGRIARFSMASACFHCAARRRPGRDAAGHAGHAAGRAESKIQILPLAAPHRNRCAADSLMRGARSGLNPNTRQDVAVPSTLLHPSADLLRGRSRQTLYFVVKSQHFFNHVLEMSLGIFCHFALLAERAWRRGDLVPGVARDRGGAAERVCWGGGNAGNAGNAEPQCGAESH